MASAGWDPARSASAPGPWRRPTAVSPWLGTTPRGGESAGRPAGNPGAANPAFSTQFEEWQRAHFSLQDLATPTISGPLADPNGDGIINLLKYACGCDPWVQTPTGFEPRVEIGGGTFRLSYRIVRNAVDLQIGAEFGADLVSWMAAGGPVAAPTNHGDGTETRHFEWPNPPAGQGFGRIRVSLVEP